MDKKSAYLIALFLVLMVFSTGVMFLRYIVFEDIDFYIDEEAFNQSLLVE